MAPDCRRVGRLGAEPIQLAVGSAHAQGCETFLARVQMDNVGLFENLSWQSLAPVDVHGHPHMEMVADLAAYPTVIDPARGWLSLSRRRAA